MAKRRAPRHLAQLIVDDSADEDVKVQVRQVATAFRARLLSLPQREAIGDKRQLAAETLARRHDVVVHWCVRGRRHRCTAMQRCMPGHAPRRDDDDHYRRGRLSAQVAPLVVPGHTAGAADLSVLQHSTYYMLRSDRLLKLPQAKSGPHFGTLAYRSAVLADSAVRYSNTSMGEDQYFAERAVNHGFRAAVLDNNASHFTYVRHHNTWNFSMSAYGSFQVVQEVPAWFLPTSLWMRSHAHMLMSGPGAQARCMADMDAVQECRAVWGSWWEAAHGGVMYMAWCGGGGGGASWAARCTCPALESCAGRSWERKRSRRWKGRRNRKVRSVARVYKDVNANWSGSEFSSDVLALNASTEYVMPTEKAGSLIPWPFLAWHACEYPRSSRCCLDLHPSFPAIAVPIWIDFKFLRSLVKEAMGKCSWRWTLQLTLLVL